MFNDWRDRLGVCLSVLCMAHCLLTPIVLAIVPLGAAIGFWHTGFHHLFLLLVPLIAAAAFVPGWRLHRDSRVWVFAAIGFVFLLAGSQVGFLFGLNQFGLEQGSHADHGLMGLHDLEWAPILTELVLTSIGGGFFIRAHLLNRKLCACCRHDHAHAPQPVAQRP